MGFLATTAAAAAITLAVAVVSPHAEATAATGPSLSAAPFQSTSALRGLLKDSDFVLDLPAIEGFSSDGGTVRPAFVGSFPALGLPDVQMSIANVQLEAGAFNQPHVHPRGSELLFLVKGRLDVFFIEDAGAPPRVVTNTLDAGSATVFGIGLVHGERCVSDTPCEFVAVLNNPDAGSASVVPSVCGLPGDVPAVALGVPRRVADKVCAGAPAPPAFASRRRN